MAGANTTIAGLKDIYYALMTDSAAETYGKPVKIGHAISVSINPNTATKTIYGDNKAVATKSKLVDIDVSISSTDIPFKDRAAMLGHTVNSDGSITIKGDDSPPYVALLFAATSFEDTTQYYKFYKGKFTPNQQDFETEREDFNDNSPTLEGKFIARTTDGKIYDMVDSAESGSSTVISSWFDSV